MRLGCVGNATGDIHALAVGAIVDGTQMTVVRGSLDVELGKERAGNLNGTGGLEGEPGGSSSWSFKLEHYFRFPWGVVDLHTVLGKS